MRAVSTFFFVLVAVWVSELTAVSDTVPEPVEDQNHYRQTTKGECPLSTCVDLVSDLGSAEHKLMNMEEKIRAMEEKMRTMEGELHASQNEIEQLKSKYEVGKLAFFASLTGIGGATGPYNTKTTLVYKDVMTNIGNAYNSGTGIFTAPVKGIYFFSFYYHASTLHPADLYLQKNGQTLAVTSHHKIDLGIANGSNGVTVQLEVGDHVCVVLRANSWVYDGPDHHTTFNGFLVHQLL